MLQPRYIPTRMMCAVQAIEGGRFDEARAEINVVLDHPGLEDYVRGRTDSLTPFFNITGLYLIAGRADEVRTVAERARDLAVRLDHDAGLAHFNLARVYAVLAKSDPDLIPDAARQLFRALIANPDFQRWYRDDVRWFGPVRTGIEEVLGRMEDPAVVRRRLIASRATR